MPTPMTTAKAMMERSRAVRAMNLASRRRRLRRPRRAPARARRRRRLRLGGWLGRLGEVLPQRLDPELLLVPGLGHRRGELDAREERGALEQRDELVRCAGLARDLQPLLVHGQ